MDQLHINRETKCPILYKDLENRSSFYHDSEALPAESRLGDKLATWFTGPRPSRPVLFHDVKTALKGRWFQDVKKVRKNVSVELKAGLRGTFNNWPVQILSKMQEVCCSQGKWVWRKIKPYSCYLMCTPSEGPSPRSLIFDYAEIHYLSKDDYWLSYRIVADHF